MTAGRLNRLFHSVSHRCFDVAVDHGLFNEFAGLERIEGLSIEAAFALLAD